VVIENRTIQRIMYDFQPISLPS